MSRVIHGACVDADHAHSGAVATEIVPVPPPGPMTDAPESVTAHLISEGPTAVVDVEPQPLTAIIIAMAEAVRPADQARGDRWRGCEGAAVAGVRVVWR